MENRFQPGDIVRHFKHETLSPEERAQNKYLYRIIGTATHSETGEPMMVYQPMYDGQGMYVRPLEMFLSEVDHGKYPQIRQKYRFEKCEAVKNHYVRHEDAEPEVMNNGITKRILSYDDSLMVEELIFEQGAESRTHTHTPVQIPYVKSGLFEFTAGDESFLLREGDTAYMGPDEPHHVRCIEAGTLVVSFSPAREDYLRR